MPELTAYRALFPAATRYRYFNHAGVAPTSTRVQAAVNAALTDLVEHGVGHETAWEQSAAQARRACGGLIAAPPESIAFVRNTSHGLGLFAEGFDWRPGDEVAVCLAEEYPSNIYPWLHLGSRGVQVVEIPARGGGVHTEAVAAVLTPRTRVVAVSAVQYASGHRTDLVALGALCRERRLILCVDGIQQVGALPLDVEAAGIHVLSADSHKWMLGLSGIGFLYVAPALIERLRPVLVGWKSTTDAWNFDRAQFTLRPDAARLEEGSPAYTLLPGLGAAAELLLEVGLPTIAAAIRARCERLVAGLERLGFAVGPLPTDRAGIVTATHPDRPVAAFKAPLAEAQVVASVRRQRLRFSPHFYTSESDVDAVLVALAATL